MGRRTHSPIDDPIEKAVRDVREARRALSLMYAEMEDIAETLPPGLRRRAERIIDMFLDARIDAEDALRMIRRLREMAEKR